MNINDKKTLAIYPYIEEIGYADPISSEKLNKQFESLRESVLRAIIRTQEINSTLAVYEEAFNAQSITLGNYYNTLAQQLDDNFDIAYITSHDKNIQYTNIKYDTAYGFTTLGLVSNYSKIPRMEGYNGKVSPDVEIYINGVKQEFDSDAYRALDGSLKTVWFKQFQPNEQIVFEIVLPQTLTKRFNYIEINPFPVFSYTINKITYENLYGVETEVTKEFQGTYNPITSTTKCTPIKLYMSPKEFNGIVKIYATADENGYFGFSNLDIGFMDFNNTTSECFMLFNSLINNKITQQLKLNTISTSFYFDAPAADALLKGATPVLEARLVIAHKVLQPDGSYVITPISQGIKLDISSGGNINLHNQQIELTENNLLYLHLKFTEHNMTTPVFRGAKLTYKRTT